MPEPIKYSVHDVYLGAYMASLGFPMEVELIAPTKVAFVFTGVKEEIDSARNQFFNDAQVQRFVGQIRQLKVSLHDRLRHIDNNKNKD
jgi:hypothetical protein